MNRLRLLLPAIAAIFLLLGACSRGENDAPSTKKMAQLTADLELANAYASSQSGSNTDSLRRLLRQGVMKKHGVTEEQYLQAMDWYGHHIDKYYDMCEQAEKVMDKRSRQLASLQESPLDDANDLWPTGHFAMLSPTAVADAIRVEIPTDEMAPGDELTLSLCTLRPISVMMMLQAVYADGSLDQRSQRTYSRMNGSVKLQLDTAKTLQNLYARISIPPEQKAEVWVDSIQLRRIPFTPQN